MRVPSPNGGIFFCPMIISRFKLLALTGILTLSACHQQPKVILHANEAIVSKPQTKAVKQNHNTVTIAAVGDMMLGTAYPNKYSLPPDSGKNSFKAAQQYLHNADISFGHLEGTLVDSGNPIGK